MKNAYELKNETNIFHVLIKFKSTYKLYEYITAKCERVTQHVFMLLTVYIIRY